MGEKSNSDRITNNFINIKHYIKKKIVNLYEELKVYEVIKKFEKHNNLKIEDYVSDGNDNIDNKHFDNYIGNDVFREQIKDWITSFEAKDQFIFYRLLMNYKYFTENELRKVLRSIINEVREKVEKINIDFDNVYFITFPSEEGVKSGGDDIRSLIGVVAINLITKNKIISNIKYNKERILSNAEAIVILDDIVGSGFTLYSNICELIEILELQKHKNIKVFLELIAGREKKVKEKVKQLKKKYKIDIDYRIYYQCEKCFDEMSIFDKHVCKKNKEIVEQYEEKIDKTKRDEDKSNVLGFMGNQFLVSFRYNTPNNTLCNFWKPSDSNSPLFIRTSYKRPSIDDIRKKKKNNENKAYNFGKVLHNYEKEIRTKNE